MSFSVLKCGPLDWSVDAGLVCGSRDCPWTRPKDEHKERRVDPANRMISGRVDFSKKSRNNVGGNSPNQLSNLQSACWKLSHGRVVRANPESIPKAQIGHVLTTEFQKAISKAHPARVSSSTTARRDFSLGNLFARQLKRLLPMNALLPNTTC